MVTWINERLISWASILDPPTERQAIASSQLPVVEGHVALMPDAHLGTGAVVGSVIPTRGAVIPSAVGVDIGCGMAARRLHLDASAFGADERREWLGGIHSAVPAGLGKWHRSVPPAAKAWFEHDPPPPTLDDVRQAMEQLGTLGSGNHFLELAADTQGRMWILLHSGSRGAGNKLATSHTRIAKRVCSGPLPDRDLAWLEEGTAEFDAYLRDLRWSQRYALRNRELMLDAALDVVRRVARSDVATDFEVNCHHNYTELEEHGGRRLWITRKGAIRAGRDDRGLIPSAMGGRSFVVRGRGNALSYESCSHGAGRSMSRTRARKTLSLREFSTAMRDAAWQHEHAEKLLDEAPSAYKPIDVVMRDQADLVEVEYELRAIANYKGTS